MKELTYDQAYKKLEKIVGEIESDSTQIDTLADKVKEAKVLVGFCEKRLRDIEYQIEANKSSGKKK